MTEAKSRLLPEKRDAIIRAAEEEFIQWGYVSANMTRIADGQSISLDSFIRVIQALGLASHLEALLPDPEVRPVERASRRGGQRRRASTRRKTERPWQWGDEGDER